MLLVFFSFVDQDILCTATYIHKIINKMYIKSAPQLRSEAQRYSYETHIEIYYITNGLFLLLQKVI